MHYDVAVIYLNDDAPLGKMNRLSMRFYYLNNILTS